MILTPLTMWTTVNAHHPSAAAPLVAPLVAYIVVLAVMIIMLMIMTNAAPWVTTTAATILANMIFFLLTSVGSFILETVNQLALLMLPLRSCHILKDLTILPGKPTQMKILITLLIVTIPTQNFIARLLTQNMNLTKILILVTSPHQTCLQRLTSATLMTPKLKNTATC